MSYREREYQTGNRAISELSDLLKRDGVEIHYESNEALRIQHTHHIGKQLNEADNKGTTGKIVLRKIAVCIIFTFMFLWQKACMSPEVMASLCSLVNRW